MLSSGFHSVLVSVIYITYVITIIFPLSSGCWPPSVLQTGGGRAAEDRTGLHQRLYPSCLTLVSRLEKEPETCPHTHTHTVGFLYFPERLSVRHQGESEHRSSTQSDHRLWLHTGGKTRYGSPLQDEVSGESDRESIQVVKNTGWFIWTLAQFSTQVFTHKIEHGQIINQWTHHYLQEVLF